VDEVNTHNVADREQASWQVIGSCARWCPPPALDRLVWNARMRPRALDLAGAGRGR